MKEKKKRILKVKDYEIAQRTFHGKGTLAAVFVSIVTVLALGCGLAAAFIMPSSDDKVFIPLIIASGFLILIILFTVFYYTMKGKKYRKNNKTFLIKPRKEGYKIVTKLTTDIISEAEMQQMIRENKKPKNKIQFKEEIVAKQTLSNLATVQTFDEFAFFIDQYFLHRGIKTNVGNQLVAALLSSKLIFLRSKKDIKSFSENINGCFNSPTLVADGSRFSTIADDHTLFDAINTARSLKDEEIFLVVNNLDPDDVAYYLSPLKDLLISGNRNATIKLPDNEIKLPTNLFVVVTFTNYYDVFKVEQETLSHSALVQYDYEEVEIEGVAKPVDLGQFNIRYNLNSLKDSCFLDESYWKTIDSIEELFTKVANYKFDNKMLLRLESYIALFINNIDNQAEAVDYALANLVLIPSLVKCGKEKLMGDNDIKVLFNSLYSDTEMIRAREIIDEFFNLNSEVEE